MKIDNKTNYYIAETAFHHEGDIDFLKTLIETVATIDIDAIKFHLLFDSDDYMVSSHSALSTINSICLPNNKWEGIFNQVVEKGKSIVALVNDVAALKFINSIQDNYPIDAIELHSTGLNDLFLLQEAVKFSNTIILGVGGSSMDEIQFAVDYLQNEEKKDLLLMHGFQNYPTNYHDINFKRIRVLQELFQLPVGYADHSNPVDPLNAVISTLPVALGVNVFEKHVTHVPAEKRIDAQAAVSLSTMQEVISIGDNLLKSMGDAPIVYSIPELNYGNTGPMKKALVARTPLDKGHVLTLDDIAYKRTESSSPLQQKDILKLIGLTVKENIKKDQLLSFENVQYEFKTADFSQFNIKK